MFSNGTKRLFKNGNHWIRSRRMSWKICITMESIYQLKSTLKLWLHFFIEICIRKKRCTEITDSENVYTTVWHRTRTLVGKRFSSQFPLGQPKSNIRAVNANFLTPNYTMLHTLLCILLLHKANSTRMAVLFSETLTLIKSACKAMAEISPWAGQNDKIRIWGTENVFNIY